MRREEGRNKEERKNKGEGKVGERWRSGETEERKNT